MKWLISSASCISSGYTLATWCTTTPTVRPSRGIGVAHSRYLADHPADAAVLEVTLGGLAVAAYGIRGGVRLGLIVSLVVAGVTLAVEAKEIQT